jgi:hypothetical protein
MDARDAVERVRERWGCRGPGVPLRVRARLASPIACESPSRIQPLDSALEWAALHAVAGPPSDLSWPRVPLGLLPSPLAAASEAGWEIACCSSARATHAREDRRKHRRRPHGESYGIEGRVQTGGGPFKALDLTALTLCARELVWDVRADEERLRDLLSRLAALGHRAGAGLGSVDHWLVERAEVDTSLRRDGMPARPLPVPSCEAAVLLYGDAVEIDEVAVRGPYWHRGCRTLAALPPC